MRTRVFGVRYNGSQWEIIIFLHLIRNLFNKSELFFLDLRHLISLLSFGAKNVITNVYFSKKITFPIKIHILFSTYYIFLTQFLLLLILKKTILLCNLIYFLFIYPYLHKICIIIIYFLLHILYNTNSLLLFCSTFSWSFVHIQNETKHYNYHILYFFH